MYGPVFVAAGVDVITDRAAAKGCKLEVLTAELDPRPRVQVTKPRPSLCPVPCRMFCRSGGRYRSQWGAACGVQELLWVPIKINCGQVVEVI